MDLSFRFDRDVTVTAIPTELAVLMVGVSARQAASPTARIQMRISRAAVSSRLLAPAHGAFSLATETLLTGWKGR
ncbi:MAG: hypothetical protein CVT77_02750 [Alphaproteobacteria bacterium HGW-Alphaproteobacteria-16]|nr:MAG: hypothetical protein CVT77_02750 [Alphaproteobacteria bacterium HGW-Alphaproteobacteria-16]